MKSSAWTATLLAAAALPVANSLRILQSNDDGWAEGNVRAFNDVLRAAGHAVVLSCPADNESGRGSLDTDPKPRKDPCMYNSCPANSGAIGSNTTRPDLNWVNSYPVTSTRYGIDTIAPKLWKGAKPDLVVTGPNTGPNLWAAVQFSGTVGAACYAAHQASIPAIAFSGGNRATHPWNTPTSLESAVFAEISANITHKVIDSGKPYLPKDVFLNVNIPEIVAGGGCSKASDVRYILTRINPGVISPPDVKWCGTDRLPTEFHVHQNTPCAVSISVGDAADKTTVDAERQKVVLEKLKPMLSCIS
ncbi:hypothetical protein QQS21_007229 [Conoideocrella luteorostrata]|uniref:Survival protein SurE-like phosphatase/nucleotidase domain-containing protein n=1 Tax=Conoideocrella luteorostrata TaxID=1105319 RepID=A0AAJ0CNU6_9HYPO|nr:hypothetical protein QQS21_007229 [Conoideocrella luteorostrata]